MFIYKFVLFAFVFNSPELSGNFCATVFWTKEYGFKTEFWGEQSNLTQVQKGVARTCYADTTLENGYVFIKLKSAENSTKILSEQTFRLTFQ